MQIGRSDILEAVKKIKDIIENDSIRLTPEALSEIRKIIENVVLV